MNLRTYPTPDYKVIMSLYNDKKDLALAWPKAKYPFDLPQWSTWFENNLNKTTYSLVLCSEDELAIGHGAVLVYKNEPGLTYLCFLLIDKKFRHQGYGRELVKRMCQFVKNDLGKSEVYLLVDKNNFSAIKCYKACGFKYLDGNESMRFKKTL